MAAITSLFKKVVSAFTELASAAPLIARSGSLLGVPFAVGTKPSNLYGYLILNPNTVDVFLKFYDQTAAPVVGTDPVVYGPLQIPSNGEVVLLGTDVIKNFSVLMQLGISTDPLDTGVALPASGIIVNINYLQ